jgi:hypothetical protein
MWRQHYESLKKIKVTTEAVPRSKSVKIADGRTKELLDDDDGDAALANQQSNKGVIVSAKLPAGAPKEEVYTNADVEPREVRDPPREGKDKLSIQPHDFSPAREVIEQENRNRFAGHFKFADMYTGATRTFDELGRYNCGRCNQYKDPGDKCLLVKIRRVDSKAGSCGDWENRCSGDPEMKLNLKSIESAGYGVAKNGVGFGCHRCPFASKAFKPDSRGRTLYCGLGDFRTFQNACCALNGAPTKDDDGEEE